jgi:hypothetical protein
MPMSRANFTKQVSVPRKRKKGISRTKKKSTISKKAYKNMRRGFPK